MIRACVVGVVLAATLCSLTGGVTAPRTADTADPPRLAPDGKAETGKAWAWTSDGGLRYTWVLPKGYDDSARTYNLILICHGTGLDYRWGAANYKPGAFRPGDIVVSMDGPTEAEDGTHLFLGRPDDSMAFRDFLLEMSRAFAVGRIFLYGHSQGSFFVTYFAGVFPGLAEGVVAHASGVWTWTNTVGGIQDVPIVFMHGTKDPVVPYAQSIGARDYYAKKGHKMVGLRRLPGYNHWPNAVRASECLDFCIGMSSSDPAEVLACAAAMLKVKGPDEYEYECAPAYSLARQVLRRLVEDKPLGRIELEDLTPESKAAAQALIDRIDAEGAKHVAALRKQIAAPKDFVLDGGGWLGYLVSLREDFRGVESVEAYIKEIGFDEEAARNAEAAKPLLEAWYGRGDEWTEKARFEAAAATLPHCFLYEPLPPDLAATMKKWHDNAKDLALSEESLERYENVELWQAAWKAGLEEYAAIWKHWK